MSKEFHEVEPVMVDIQEDIERRYDLAGLAEAATRGSVRIWMLIALGMAIVIVSGASLLIGRSISKALLAMVLSMSKLAKGDSTVAVPGLGRADEIGEMAEAVRVFKTSMVETERRRAEQSALEQRQRHRGRAEMHKAGNALGGAA